MEFIFLLFIIFVGGGLLAGKILGNLFFPKDNFDYSLPDEKLSPTIINNFKTENHLHISKGDLEKLINEKKSV